jgi:hypothetical protein
MTKRLYAKLVCILVLAEVAILPAKSDVVPVV